jgi:hypothetical protein
VSVSASKATTVARSYPSTPARMRMTTHLPVISERTYDLDYERVTRAFFAISMERDGTVYYSRCNFSRSAGGSIHCFDLAYPQRGPFETAGLGEAVFLAALGFRSD